MVMTLINLGLTLLVLTMTSCTCRSCQFPVYMQSATPETEIKETRRRDWQARSRSRTVQTAPMRVVVDGGTLIWNAVDQNGDAEEVYRDQCLEEIDPADSIGELLFVVAHDDNRGRRLRACVAFRPRSPEVVLLVHVITADTCDVSRFNYSAAWLFVNTVALYQPLPASLQRSCALRGGFQMRISGTGTGNGNRGAADRFRKCGSFVEMRLESDCSGESGMYFDFRLDACVPEGLYMYAKQRTLCVANWTTGPYTFMLLRHDVLLYSWIIRFQTSLEESFVAYLLTDLVDDVSDVPTLTSRYFRLDMVRSATVPATSLCVDESEVCTSTSVRGSPRCDNADNATTTAARALTCPRACGLCNATRPTLCQFPSKMSGTWNDGLNSAHPGFQLSTATNRKSINIENPAVAVKERFYCIQWEVDPTSAKRPTSGNRFAFNEFLMVREPARGCRRRYACARVVFKSSSVMYFRFSKMRTWPFTLLPSDPVDCSQFAGETRFRVLISRERRDPVACHLPAARLTNYSVTFGGSDFRQLSCDASVIVVPEIRHRLRLTLAECTSATTGSDVTFDCLDSMLVSPSSDVIVVTNIVSMSTSGPDISSSTQRARFADDSVIKSGNISSEKPTSTNSTLRKLMTSSSPFQLDSVYCWVFPRASFPYEFSIVPGSQCSDAAVTSSTRVSAMATFVRTRVRSPRLFAADRRPTTVSTSGRSRDSRRLSELSQSDREDWQNEQPRLLRTTVRSELRGGPLLKDRDDDTSTFALFAAAIVFAIMQCAFLCIV